MDAKQKLLEIAALDLGGRPDDYRVGGGRVYHRANPARHLTFTQAAQRAIALGGKYDGHELPSNIHRTTRASATALAGLGLMGVAKDVYPHDGETHSYVVGFAEVEVDVETGVVKLVKKIIALARREGIPLHLAIVSAASFTSTSRRRDQVSAPYRVGERSQVYFTTRPPVTPLI